MDIASPTSNARLTASFIICTMNRAGDLRRLLDSVPAQTRLLDELIVVDAGEDDTEAVVNAFAADNPDCRVVYRHKEPGLTRQRNAGVSEARGSVLHFMDDDCILDSGYIEAVQSYFEMDSESAVLGAAPMLALNHGKPGPWSWFIRRFFMLTHTDGDGRLQPSGFGTLTFYSSYDEPHDMELASGCCAYRASVFERLSFDEFFDGYGRHEDLDFSHRVSRMGGLVGLPSARMEHLESPHARTGHRRLARMSIVNHYYVHRKHVSQSLYHRFCFWWSEMGQNLYRVRIFLRTGDWGIFLGIWEGYGDIIRGRVAEPSETES